MSWPFLIYVMDVLTTDGTYAGWGFLMFLSGIAYIAMYAFSKIDARTNQFFIGQNLVLNQDWKTFKSGDKLIVNKIFNDGDIQVYYPNGELSGYLRAQSLLLVTSSTQSENINTVSRDLTKAPRRMAMLAMVVCFVGILYANFMPQRDTAYKMLAAYVGQNIVESPRTQQLADSTIKYLDAQIKKYTVEVEKDSKAPEADKVKNEKASQ